MHSSYILPILVILFKGGVKSDNNSELRTFVKLCFLPRSPITFDYKMWKSEDSNKNPYHVVLGNKVMQDTLSHYLNPKNESVLSEDLDKMCAKTTIESVNEDGTSYSGKLWGFKNNSFRYNCQGSKDVVGIQRCKFESPFKKIDEDILTYFHMANDDVVMEINCFDNVKVAWVLYSQNPSKISEEEKKSYFAQANALGFPENTNVYMYRKNCSV